MRLDGSEHHHSLLSLFTSFSFLTFLKIAFLFYRDCQGVESDPGREGGGRRREEEEELRQSFTGKPIYFARSECTAMISRIRL